MKHFFKNPHFYDFLGLTGIGAISFGYCFYFKKFAETHIQLPFLNFPIFIGEILIFFCVILFLLKYFLKPKRLSKVSLVILLYFLFVIVKAFLGYRLWGPLAFRHAALFYYPIFIVLGYSFYKKEFFHSRVLLILFLALMVLFVGIYRDFWMLTIFLLSVIIICQYPHKTTKYFMCGLLLLLTPYKTFFMTARTMMLSNIITSVFIVVFLYTIVPIKRNIKIGFVVGIFIFLGIGFSQLSNRNAITSVFNFKRIYTLMSQADKVVDRFIDDYEMIELKEVQVYNPENDRVVSPVEEDFAISDIDEEISWEPKDVIITEEIKSPSSQTVGSKGKHHPVVERQLISEEDLPSISEVNKDSLLDEQTTDVSKEEIIIAQQKQEKVDKRYNSSFKTTRESVIQKEDLSKKNESSSVSTRSVPSTEKIKKLREARKRINPDVSYHNAIFRLIIWRDMFREMIQSKPFLGFSFGRPLRSICLEILNWASGEWKRDGWVSPHNSYFHVLYRSGFIGVVGIFCLFYYFIKMVAIFVHHKSVIGVLLSSAILQWFVSANFLPVFELPYTAIPLWTLSGMTLAYCHNLTKKVNR